MLFGIERSRGRAAATKEDLYTRYLPWDYAGAFGGFMDIRVEDKEYRLQRSFHANDKFFTVTDLATGREVKLKEGRIDELVKGLTESIYKNTISMEQLKTRTDTELASQVNNYIANLSVAKCREVDVSKALRCLAAKKKELESADKTAEMNVLQGQIDQENENEKRIEALTIQMKSLLVEEKRIKDENDALAKALDCEDVKRMEQLPAIIEKYDTYQELVRQNAQLKLQETQLKQQEVQLKQQGSRLAQQESTLSLEDTPKKWQRQEDGLFDSNRYTEKLRQQRAALDEKYQQARIACMITGAVITAFLLWMGKLHPIVILLAAICCITAFFMNGMLKRWYMQQLQHLENHIKDGEARQKESMKQLFAWENVKQQLSSLKEQISRNEDSMDAIYEVIMRYILHFIQEDELTDSTMCRLQEEIRRRQQQISQKQAEANKRQEDRRLQIEKLKWEISGLEGNEEELIKNEARYEALSRQQKQNEEELQAVTLATDTIKQLSADIHDSFGCRLNHAVSEIIGNITQQKYTDIRVDEKLDVKALQNGGFIRMDRLSAGTMDQFYFALRLAVAGLLLDDKKMPLILDECFAHYDESRAKAALCRIADRQQVILFTCHKREQKLLEELELPYHYIDLSRGFRMRRDGYEQQ
jgi:DNA repair exonuclease SbcCD ATPase subunit